MMTSLQQAISSLLYQWRSTKACAAVFVFIIFFCLCPPTHGEDECQKSNVMCYDCDSRNDTACADPFNVTAAMMANITTRSCHGCCVKVVRKKHSPLKKYIWRTCTTNLKINLFMVDHVCMEEAGNVGHMCFCETNICNGAGGLTNVLPVTTITITTIATLLVVLSIFSSDFITSSRTLLSPKLFFEPFFSFRTWRHWLMTHFCGCSSALLEAYRLLPTLAIQLTLLMFLTACIFFSSSSYSASEGALLSVW